MDSSPLQSSFPTSYLPTTVPASSPPASSPPASSPPASHHSELPQTPSPFKSSPPATNDPETRARAFFENYCRSHFARFTKKVATERKLGLNEIPPQVLAQVKSKIRRQATIETQRHLNKLRQQAAREQQAFQESPTPNGFPPLDEPAISESATVNGLPPELAFSPMPDLPIPNLIPVEPLKPYIPEAEAQVLPTFYQPVHSHMLSTGGLSGATLVDQPQQEYSWGAGNGQPANFGGPGPAIANGVNQDHTYGNVQDQRQAQDHYYIADPMPPAQTEELREPEHGDRRCDVNNVSPCKSKAGTRPQPPSVDQIGRMINEAEFFAQKDKLATAIQELNNAYQYYPQILPQRRPMFLGTYSLLQREVEVAMTGVLAFASYLKAIQYGEQTKNHALLLNAARRASKILPIVLNQAEAYVKTHLALIIDQQTRWTTRCRVMTEIVHQFTGIKAMLMRWDKNAAAEGQEKLVDILALTRADIWRYLTPSSDDDLTE